MHSLYGLLILGCPPSQPKPQWNAEFDKNSLKPDTTKKWRKYLFWYGFPRYGSSGSQMKRVEKSFQMLWSDQSAREITIFSTSLALTSHMIIALHLGFVCGCERGNPPRTSYYALFWAEPGKHKPRRKHQLCTERLLLAQTIVYVTVLVA